MKYVKRALTIFITAGLTWLAWDAGYKEGVDNAVKAIRLNQGN